MLIALALGPLLEASPRLPGASLDRAGDGRLAPAPAGASLDRAGDGRLAPAPAASACAMLSAQQCLLWQELYDSLGGPTWRHCNASRASPCGCGKPGEATYGVHCTGGANGTHAITQLVLFENNMAGTLPSSMGGMDRMTEIVLNDNAIEGSIPASLVKLAGVSWLWLHNNRLRGRVPPLNFNQCAGYCDVSARAVAAALPPLPPPLPPAAAPLTRRVPPLPTDRQLLRRVAWEEQHVLHVSARAVAAALPPLPPPLPPAAAPLTRRVPPLSKTAAKGRAVLRRAGHERHVRRRRRWQE
jgi:hypothetical protein